MASGFRLAFFLCLTAVLISETWCIRRVPRCPKGWSLYGSRCFCVFRRSCIAADAELSCVHYGGNLASIHSTGENNFIKHLVYRRFRSYRSIWIGLHDCVGERKWMWMDGSKVGLTCWSRGQPDNRGNQDCTEMKGIYWNDISCYYNRPYVCARPSLRYVIKLPPRTTRPPRTIRPGRPGRPRIQ